MICVGEKMPNSKTHENMRFRTMTLEQLYTRLYKITDKQKLTNFIECCTLPGYFELGQSARERYRSLFSESAPAPVRSKTCPVCRKDFTLQEGVDGDYCSEKCLRLGTFINWEREAFSRRVEFNYRGEPILNPILTPVPIPEYKTSKSKKKPEPKKPIDFIDILPKRKLRLD